MLHYHLPRKKHSSFFFRVLKKSFEYFCSLVREDLISQGHHQGLSTSKEDFLVLRNRLQLLWEGYYPMNLKFESGLSLGLASLLSLKWPRDLLKHWKNGLRTILISLILIEWRLLSPSLKHYLGCQIAMVLLMQHML